MREIKFRAWDTESKKFRDEITADTSWLDSDSWDDPEEQFEYLTLNPAYPLWHLDRFIYEEWTGFVDKNGKDVYEGDIIKRDIDDAHFGVTSVIFEHGSFIESKYKYNLSFIAGLGVHSDTLSNFTVIGNVNENPDLLK